MKPVGTKKFLSNGHLQCRLCGRQEWMRFVYEERGYHIVQCPSCNFLSTDPIPTNDELAAYYASYFLREDKKNIACWDQPRMSVFAQIEQLIHAAGIQKDAAILDVGAAYGAFLLSLKTQGYSNLTGIDLSEPAVAHLNTLDGIQGLGGDLPDAGFESNCFDVVTLIDTLEHLPNFKDIVQEVSRILKPGGVVAIRVPNMHFHLAKMKIIHGIGWSSPYGMFTPPGHLNHFIPEGLAHLLQTFGLSAEQFANGATDHNGSVKRVFALTLLTRFANLYQQFISPRCIGNSLVVIGRKPQENMS